MMKRRLEDIDNLLKGSRETIIALKADLERGNTALNVKRMIDACEHLKKIMEQTAIDVELMANIYEEIIARLKA